MPYCPRCGTALSSHELGQADVYRDEEDESAYVRFRLVDVSPADRRAVGDAEWLAVWTTTPWTLLVEHRCGRQPGADLRRRRRAGHGRRPRRRRAGGRGDGPGLGPGPRFRAGRPALRAPVRRPRPAARCRRVAGRPRRIRHDRGGHRARAPRARLRRDRPPDRARERPALAEPGRPRRPLHRRHRLAGGARRAGGQPRHQRPPGGGGTAGAAHALRALVPPLLALPHPAHLLGQAELVHRHVDAQGRPAGGQRDGGLAPGPHQGREVRRVAGQQRRLGPVARPLLGHALADLALRAGSPALRRVAGRALRPVRARRDRDRPPPPDDRRGDVHLLDMRSRGATTSTTCRCRGGSSR